MANDELEAVKAALRNHNLCNDACTPAKHIECVYADLENATNRIRSLVAALKSIRSKTNISPGSMMPVGEIWRIANDALKGK